VEESLASFRRATQINGRYADAYYSAGLAFIQLGRYGEARTVLEYARNLYLTMGQSNWAVLAQTHLSRLPN
jgi:tetratricopeptide (TPR) repeat protein